MGLGTLMESMLLSRGSDHEERDDDTGVYMMIAKMGPGMVIKKNIKNSSLPSNFSKSPGDGFMRLHLWKLPGL